MEQKELVNIFNRLKRILKKFESPLKPKLDLDSKYDLWSIKDIEIEGRKRNEVFFAAAIIQSNYVGFYYMPIYVDTTMEKIFKPELLKLLKGKSCFHIRKIDKELEKQIEDALKKRYCTL